MPKFLQVNIKLNNYQEFLQFIEKHPTFMCKPLDGLGGKGVSKESVSDIENKKAYFDNMIEKHLFLEEVVVQHEDLNKLCSKSVNTMRIMTFYNNGNPRILWAGLRVGNGVNSIDNFHAKGMAVNIDMETGKTGPPQTASQKYWQNCQLWKIKNMLSLIFPAPQSSASTLQRQVQIMHS